jgi:hypothetical protein
VSVQGRQKDRTALCWPPGCSSAHTVGGVLRWKLARAVEWSLSLNNCALSSDSHTEFVAVCPAQVALLTPPNVTLIFGIPTLPPPPPPADK